jgi:hypothetical protein
MKKTQIYFCKPLNFSTNVNPFYKVAQAKKTKR